jgi:hypothetical protein
LESSFLIRFHARGPKCQLQSFLPPWSPVGSFATAAGHPDGNLPEA